MSKPLSCTLVTIQSADGVKQKIVNETPFTIGRSVESPIIFPENTVSRNHLEIRNKAGKIWIVDEKSANGTFLNGERLPPGRKIQIQPSDTIRLGKSSTVIQIQSLERAFTEAALDESSIKQEDHSKIMDLVQGAHAEANRLVEAGRKINENMVRFGEERAQKMVQDAATEANKERAKILSAIQGEAEVLRKDLLQKAHDEVRVLREKAIVDGDSVRAKASTEADLSRANASAEAARILQQARQAQIDTEHKVQREIENLHAEAEKEARQNGEQIVAELREATLRDLAGTLKELEETRKELADLKPSLVSSRLESEKLKADADTLRQEIADLRSSEKMIATDLQNALAKSHKVIDEIKALEAKHVQAHRDIDDLKKRGENSERELQRRDLEGKEALDKEMQRRTQAMEEELAQLRAAQVERFKLERQEAANEIIRDRERLSKKMAMAIETNALRSISVEDWRKIASGVEAEIAAHLTKESLTSDSGSDLTPMMAEAARARRKGRARSLLQGMLAGILIVAAGEWIFERIASDRDPMKTAAEESARQQQEDLARRKFEPAQDSELRPTYAGSVVYTKDFTVNYLNPDFQKVWLKTASTYFLKHWHVQEETTVEVIATVNTLIKTLEERKAAIHPDFVADGLKKMDALESETVARVKESLGSEVRLEAFRRLEKKTYLSFLEERRPASDKNKNAD